MADETRPSSRERSPNYPAIGLPLAIEAAGKLWQKEKRTAVPPGVAVEAMGYRGLSGASRTVLAALRQYGLVGSGDGTVSVSDLAVDILVHEIGSVERVEAIKKAAEAPELFQELRQSHPDASDGAITSYLISKRRFSPDGAKKATRSFRETLLLVSRGEEGYNKASGNYEAAQGDLMTAPFSTSGQQGVGNQQLTVMQFPLGGGLRADIRFVGGELEPTHIRRLEAYLKVAAESLENT